MNKEIDNNDLAQKGILVVPNKRKDKFSIKSKIDSSELVFAIKQEIKNIRWKIGLNWLLIAKFLYLIKRDRAYKLDSVDTFGQWVADNHEFIGMGLRSTYYLVEIWENLVMKLGISPETLADVDRSSAREICRFATKGNVNNLIQLAKDNTHTELVRRLKAMSDGKELEMVKEIGVCQHKTISVVYKCRDCSLGFYSPTPTTEIIIDKAGLIDEEKAKKIALNVRVIKENPNNSYSQNSISKGEKNRITKKLK